MNDRGDIKMNEFVQMGIFANVLYIESTLLRYNTQPEKILGLVYNVL